MNIISPVRSGRVTTPFNEMRPVGNPKHVHGAVDLGEASGTMIRAPEKGNLFCYLAFREKDGMYWPDDDYPVMNGKLFPFRNYFYDMYGGILILESADKKRTHVIAHCYQKQLYRFPYFYPENWEHYEEKKKCRWPLHCHHTLNRPIPVDQGDSIGFLGDAGFSSGPHVHWEIHHGIGKWTVWKDRINPEIFL